MLQLLGTLPRAGSLMEQNYLLARLPVAGLEWSVFCKSARPVRLSTLSGLMPEDTQQALDRPGKGLGLHPLHHRVVPSHPIVPPLIE